MIRKTTHKSFVVMALLAVPAIMFFSCKKEEPANPYTNLPAVVHNDNPTSDNLPEGSFAWLHAKIFRPTCANSGCHDGTFEPEFRTMASAYNSLVNHPVIANTPDNAFTYRVVPGNANASFIHERLTTVVPFSSGQMPLAVDPDSDYPANQALYIQKVTEWINDGAKDMYGNPPPPVGVNTPPIIYGMAIFPHNNTTTPFPREVDALYGIGAIEVPSDLVDVWIFPVDDNAYPDQFASIGLKASLSASDFSTAISSTFSPMSPITALDFGNTENQFYYKTTIDLSTTTTGSTYFLRAYMDDGVQAVTTEQPNNGSTAFWYLIFSIKIQ